MAQKFSAQVHEIIRKNTALMGMVAAEATQDLINETQRPKGKGGKMPLVTGFLRASGRMSLTGVPTGPTRPPKGDAQTYRSPDTVQVKGFKLGASIFWGWTAIYARRQDLYNGFYSTNVRNWQKFVDGAVRKLRDKMK